MPLYLSLLFGITLLGSLATLAPSIHYLLELNRGLSLYYFLSHLIGLVLLLGYFLARKTPKFSLGLSCLLILLLILQGREFLPYYFNLEPSVLLMRETESIELPNRFNNQPTNQHSNNLSNSKFSILLLHIPEPLSPDLNSQLWIDEIDATKPEILALLGNLRDQDRSKLAEIYHYSFYSAPSKLALFSKAPFGAQGSTALGSDLDPLLFNSVLIPGCKEISLVLLSAPIPTSELSFHRRKAYLRRIAAQFHNKANSAIVMGNFWATPRHKVYRVFTEDCEFKDAMWGTGYKPSFLLFSDLLGFKVDHILYRGGLQVEGFKRGKNYGTKHHSFTADFICSSY